MTDQFIYTSCSYSWITRAPETILLIFISTKIVHLFSPPPPVIKICEWDPWVMSWDIIILKYLIQKWSSWKLVIIWCENITVQVVSHGQNTSLVRSNDYFSAPHVKTTTDPEVISLKYMEEAKSLFTGWSLVFIQVVAQKKIKQDVKHMFYTVLGKGCLWCLLNWLWLISQHIMISSFIKFGQCSTFNWAYVL